MGDRGSLKENCPNCTKRSTSSARNGRRGGHCVEGAALNVGCFSGWGHEERERQEQLGKPVLESTEGLGGGV